MRVAGVILAAGASRRFGSPKQWARLGGRTLLEIVVATASEAGLDPVVAVVPRGFAVPPMAVPEVNDDPGAGLSRSLRLGLAAIPPDVSAAVILLGDEPMLRPADIRVVVEMAQRAPRRIVAGRAGDRIGPPVLLQRDHFSLADAVEGDQGLGRLIADHPAVTLVDLSDVPIDIDTPEDLERLGEG
jgi:CTP:molybdopterin cytidylyltransferase MocA